MAASLDGVLIKKANRQETFTEDQIVDLQSCMDPDEGYLYFARKFAFIQHPVQGKLLFDPYEYQLRLMHSYHNYVQFLQVITSNQLNLKTDHVLLHKQQQATQDVV